jgi:hypothetical protein
MSFNLIDLVKDQLSDQVMKSIGGVIGGNESQNNLAVNSAIPGLLSSLTNFGSSSTSNADLMFKGIEKQDDGILDSLGDLLGGSGQNSLIESGGNILSSLLGGGGLASLVGSIAGFSGAGKSGTSKLLGLLAPIVFGVIKRKLMGGGGFDVGSLMSLLTGQKSNVAAAMPSGFSLMSDTASNASAAVENGVDRVVDTTQAAAKEGSSFIGKLLPLALIAGAAWLGYNYFMNNKSTEAPAVSSTNVEQTTEQTAPAIETQAPEMSGELLDLEKNLGSAMGAVTTSLGGITDVDSAKAAIPSLTEATGQLGSLGGLFAKLPEAARGPITKIVSDNMQGIQDMVTKVASIPGVGELIKPVVEKLSAALLMFK